MLLIIFGFRDFVIIIHFEVFMVLLSDVIAFYEEYYSTTTKKPSADELRALRCAIRALRRLRRIVKQKRRFSAR